jgi:hypothetical protein
MRRGIGIVLLALGTVLGFGFGFARVNGYCHHGYDGYGPGFYGHGPFGEGRRNIEDRAADACVRAAERVFAEHHAGGAATPSAPATPTPATPGVATPAVPAPAPAQ